MSAFTGNVPTADLAEEFLDRSTPLSRLRNILHRYPAISPAVVLRHRDHRLRDHQSAVPVPREPVPDHPAGRRRRNPRTRADAHHPDGRHRPVGRRGDDLLIDGGRADRRDQRRSRSRRAPPRPARRPRRRRAQRLPRDEAAAPSLHRHARHAQCLHRAHLAVLERRDDPRSRDARDPDRDRPAYRDRRRADHGRCPDHDRALLCRRASRSGAQPGGGTSTRSATTRKQRAWPASPSTGC